jgi:hypothetical protein
LADIWIKMRMALQRDPKVLRLAFALKVHRHQVIGALHQVWCTFDEYSIDGKIAYKPEEMDALLSWKGFTRAMVNIGWIDFKAPNTLIMHNFEAHNGESARKRAVDAARQSANRNKRKSAPDPLPVSRFDRDSSHAGSVTPVTPKSPAGVTREEKRREEVSQSQKQGGVVTNHGAPRKTPPAPPSKYSQDDFDERDMRLIAKAKKDLNQRLKSRIGASTMTDGEYFGIIAEDSGLTIDRILKLEVKQKTWPEAKAIL